MTIGVVMELLGRLPLSSVETDDSAWHLQNLFLPLIKRFVFEIRSFFTCMIIS